VSDIFLHHFARSPFSEKIRLVLGYKKLAWKSVTVPEIMPKPDVVALTGGYRRTPFLQIGSDIYCDTSLICDVLEHLHPTPTLYPATYKGLARILAQWADDKLFWSAMAYNFSPQGAAQMFGADAPEGWQAKAKQFGDDRAKMRFGQPRIPSPDATAAYKSYLRRLANMLDGPCFLLGDEPCIADFAAYHPLWFTRTQTSVMAGILQNHPAILTWMDHMAALGHGTHSPSNATESIAACAQSAWSDSTFGAETFQNEHGVALGEEVCIAADSFGPEASTGTLIAATRMHYTIRRTDERAGTVQVHFPRIGFILKRAEPVTKP
jgi:glutathione S-transferase